MHLFSFLKMGNIGKTQSRTFSGLSVPLSLLRVYIYIYSVSAATLWTFRCAYQIWLNALQRQSVATFYRLKTFNVIN